MCFGVISLINTFMSLEAECILCFPVFNSLNMPHRARIIMAIQTSSFKLTDGSPLVPCWGSLSQLCYDYFSLIIDAQVFSYKLSVKVFKPILRDLSTFYFSSKDGPSLDDFSSPVCSLLSHSVCWLLKKEIMRWLCLCITWWGNWVIRLAGKITNPPFKDAGLGPGTPPPCSPPLRLTPLRPSRPRVMSRIPNSDIISIDPLSASFTQH